MLVEAALRRQRGGEDGEDEDGEGAGQQRLDEARHDPGGEADDTQEGEEGDAAEGAPTLESVALPIESGVETGDETSDPGDGVADRGVDRGGPADGRFDRRREKRQFGGMSEGRGERHERDRRKVDGRRREPGLSRR